MMRMRTVAATRPLQLAMQQHAAGHVLASYHNMRPLSMLLMAVCAAVRCLMSTHHHLVMMTNQGVMRETARRWYDASGHGVTHLMVTTTAAAVMVMVTMAAVTTRATATHGAGSSHTQALPTIRRSVHLMTMTMMMHLALVQLHGSLAQHSVLQRCLQLADQT